jgi:hypothetical protein
MKSFIEKNKKLLAVIVVVFFLGYFVGMPKATTSQEKKLQNTVEMQNEKIQVMQSIINVKSEGLLKISEIFTDFDYYCADQNRLSTFVLEITELDRELDALVREFENVK